MDKIILSSITLEELEKLCIEMGLSKFRAKQIHNQIFLKFASSFNEMTDLSKSLREELTQKFLISDISIEQKQVSKDGTIKYLLRLPDGELVETVLMRFDNRANLTACVSSQVGCPMGCKFCATAKRGLIRNLTAYEITEQVMTIQRDIKEKVTNIVFMGQGEPLLNYDNLLKAMEVFNSQFPIGQRRMTVSTCGIIPQINRLAETGCQSTLAISLHASNDDLRNKIMPVNNKYPMKELKKSLLNFVEKTGRRVTIEYILIGGLNDSIDCAKELVTYLKGLKCNINFIVYNPCEGDNFNRPKKDDVMKFKFIVESVGLKATIRLERGLDIDAACGQLTGKYYNNFNR